MLQKKYQNLQQCISPAERELRSLCVGECKIDRLDNWQAASGRGWLLRGNHLDPDFWGFKQFSEGEMDHFDNGQRGALKVGGVLALQRGAIGRFKHSVMWENGSSWKLTLGSLESTILPNSLGLFNNFNNGRWIIVTIGNDVLSVGGRWQGGWGETSSIWTQGRAILYGRHRFWGAIFSRHY